MKQHLQKQNLQSVAIVGLGYVGLPLALLAAKKGYRVIGIDVDGKKTALLNKKIVPFIDGELSKQIKKTSFLASTDFSKISEVDIVVVCVPTPVFKNKDPDYSFVKAACKSIATNLHKKQLLVLESTVNPGVCEELVIPILEKWSGLSVGQDIFLAHCPERINPGDKKWNVSNIPRVVGAVNKKSLSRAQSFYRSIISGDIYPMASLREAEAVKIVENSFRNINIAFVNELAKSFAVLGIDVVSVIKGAATKPFAFLAHYPGCGIGGHCIPVDPYYLINYAKKKGFTHELLLKSCQTNKMMPFYTVNLLKESLVDLGKEVKGTKITVLGVAYKPNLDDYRESPALVIVEILKNLGANVSIYDPFVKKFSVGSLTEAIQGASGLILATAHDVFRKIDPVLLKKAGVLAIIDGRNVWNKKKFLRAGLVYKGIGR